MSNVLGAKLRTLSPADRDLLEGLIDRANLYSVLTAIRDIAEGKADHLASNWQDRYAADSWSAAAVQVSNCADRRAIGAVSL